MSRKDCGGGDATRGKPERDRGGGEGRSGGGAEEWEKRREQRACRQWRQMGGDLLPKRVDTTGERRVVVVVVGRRGSQTQIPSWKKALEAYISPVCLRCSSSGGHNFVAFQNATSTDGYILLRSLEQPHERNQFILERASLKKEGPSPSKGSTIIIFETSSCVQCSVAYVVGNWNRIRVLDACCIGKGKTPTHPTTAVKSGDQAALSRVSIGSGHVYHTG
ncbi:hypothetical protein C8Q69DRAFT_444469 [Paecilomyces variotii]|uniref:Uncharacterized protein n=1 Tax=Byssochlamys spectabilis TaxID=264951 RepID=A0A443HUR2_BYSSP|nr:hypothetical protein C8Q69DRAFT_444469 [Paecilomyces variotii]RWQ95563.1 hypothetical protein C8Q69DRAFT_444469 [Paecilomyces variotii]